jgi:hypothetical protein
MSSEIYGESEQVFPALLAGFDRSARRGEVAMTVMLSNAC